MPLLLALAASGSFYSAGNLKRDCLPSGAVETCFAYLGGARDTSEAYQQWMAFREFCPPDSGLSKADIRDATLHYLDLHSGNEDALAASIVILALKERYPCERVEFPKARPGASTPNGPQDGGSLIKAAPQPSVPLPR